MVADPTPTETTRTTERPTAGARAPRRALVPLLALLTACAGGAATDTVPSAPDATTQDATGGGTAAGGEPAPDVLHPHDPLAEIPAGWPAEVFPVPDDALLTRTVATGDGVTRAVEFATPAAPDAMDRTYLDAIAAATGWEAETVIPGRPTTIMATGPDGLAARVEVHAGDVGNDVRGTPFTLFPDGAWVAIVVEDRE